MSALTKPRMSDSRRAALVKVQIAKKELALDDSDYRFILNRLTGKNSAADCTEAELGKVLEEFKVKGWKGRSMAGTKPAPADSAVARKARAMWISLHRLGVVRDPAEQALEAFARRQLGVEKLQWADQQLAYRLIEALKAMAQREGWDQVGLDQDGAAQVAQLKKRLVKAQCKKLERDPPPGLQFYREPEVEALIEQLAAQIWRPRA